MGYGSTANFNLIEDQLAASPRAASGPRRICELGDQTIKVSQEAADNMHAFATRNRTPGAAVSLEQLRRRLDAHVGKQMHVREVFEAAGFDYVSIDVNEEGGARFVDLNYWPNEAATLGKFDVVTNFGTTEHVANQASAFATVHHLLLPGGIAIHHVPMVHCLNHALVDLTPRFLLSLATLNDYTVVQAYVQSHTLEQAIAFHYGPDILFMEGIRDMLRDSTLATMAFVVIRKNSDLPFIPPVDVGDDLERFRRLLIRGLEHYNPGLDAAGQDAAIRAAIARMGTRACFKPIAANIDKREFGQRLARTGRELAQPGDAAPAPAPAPDVGSTPWNATWQLDRVKARLAPTIFGRIKRRLLG